MSIGRLCIGENFIHRLAQVLGLEVVGLYMCILLRCLSACMSKVVLSNSFHVYELDCINITCLIFSRYLCILALVSMKQYIQSNSDSLRGA